GSFRWFLIRAIPMLDDQGRIARWYGTNTDIEERKRADEALSLANDRLRLAMEGSAKNEERFRLAAQAGKMYAYEWDVAVDKITRSEEYVNVLGFGYPTKHLNRQQLLESVHPEDRALVIGSVDQLAPQNPIT